MPPSDTPPAADATPDNVATPGAMRDCRRKRDRKWLNDCGWHGWTEDLLTGEVFNDHGDLFVDVTAMRDWLQSLPVWPEVRNVPKYCAGHATGAGGAGDVTEAVRDVIREMQSAMVDLKRDLKTLVAERDALRAAVEKMESRKDAAYEERNRVVALLASLARNGPRYWDACRSRTAIEGWSDDWHGCVYIETPGGQLSWHYHDSHAPLFAHLPFVERHPWDGHTTEEKYARIESLTGAALARVPAADKDKT